MSRKNKLLFAYLGVMVALTFVRICFNEDFFGKLDGVCVDRLFSTFAQIVCMGIIPFVAIILTEKKKNFKSIAKSIGYRPFGNGKTLVIVLVLSILHVAINSGVSTVCSMIIRGSGYTPAVSDPDVYLDFGAFLLGVFFSSVLPATFEELTHRSLALKMTDGGIVKKILVTSLLFALMHQNILQTGYTFVGGLMFGALTVITGSIFPAMIMHFINNFFVCIRVYSSGFNGIVASCVDWFYSICTTWWGVTIMTILWIGCVVLSIYLFKVLYDQNKQNIKLRPSEVLTKSEKMLSKFLWTAILVIGVSTTIYSYIWGLMR